MDDRTVLPDLLSRERSRFAAEHPRSAELFASSGHLFGNVPMTWMNKRAGDFPVYLARARGATVTDVDGRSYADFSLGDTAAMAGHSPPPVVDAVQRRFAELGGATAMLPTEDAEAVAANLTARFGPTRWSFALSATDANRWLIRMVRAFTGRPKILFHAHCYHGTVDESLIVTSAAGSRASEGSVGAPVDVTQTSRVVEFNDLDGLDQELAHGDVAAVLIEPALTNIGIVLPEPGYLAGVRDLTRRHGVLLIHDETHTFSAGPGGATRAWDLDPDLVVVGKAIGGGVPAAAFGTSEAFAAELTGRRDLDLVDMGGVGGTMAGNALSLAAARATLEEVLTEAAFEHMTALCTTYTDGVRKLIEEFGLGWSIAQIGARAEFRFTSPAPRNGTESHQAADAALEDFLHLYLANRGVLMTPFHTMVLMSPETTRDQVDLVLQVLREAVTELSG